MDILFYNQLAFGICQNSQIESPDGQQEHKVIKLLSIENILLTFIKYSFHNYEECYQWFNNLTNLYHNLINNISNLVYQHYFHLPTHEIQKILQIEDSFALQQESDTCYVHNPLFLQQLEQSRAKKIFVGKFNVQNKFLEALLNSKVKERLVIQSLYFEDMPDHYFKQMIYSLNFKKLHLLPAQLGFIKYLSLTGTEQKINCLRQMFQNTDKIYWNKEQAQLVARIPKNILLNQQQFEEMILNNIIIKYQPHNIESIQNVQSECQITQMLNINNKRQKYHLNVLLNSQKISFDGYCPEIQESFQDLKRLHSLNTLYNVKEFTVSEFLQLLPYINRNINVLSAKLKFMYKQHYKPVFNSNYRHQIHKVALHFTEQKFSDYDRKQFFDIITVFQQYQVKQLIIKGIQIEEQDFQFITQNLKTLSCLVLADQTQLDVPAVEGLQLVLNYGKKRQQQVHKPIITKCKEIDDMMLKNCLHLDQHKDKTWSQYEHFVMSIWNDAVTFQ